MEALRFSVEPVVVVVVVIISVETQFPSTSGGSPFQCGARPCSVVPPSALSFLQPQVWTSSIGRRDAGSLYADLDEPDPPVNFTSAGERRERYTKIVQSS